MQAEVVDSYRYAASIFSKVVSDGYIGMVKTIPQLYGVIYDRAERAKAAGGFRVWAAEFTARNLHGLLERMKPSVVVCTHAFPCNAMAAYKRLFDPSIPVLGIVTDYVVHPFWIYKSIDAYAVATPEERSAMIARGLDPARIEVTGIPVDPRFGRPRERDDVRRLLGLPLDKPVVLVMGGGLGLGPIATTARALAQSGRDVCAVVIVGRNARVQRRVALDALRVPYETRVLGFVDNVDAYMHAADVLVTKPGGLTVAEALVAGVPMVLMRPLPGQEERNARYLVARGAALRARQESDLARTVAALIDDAPRREALRAAAASIGFPDAALRISERIAALAAG
jgi:processive 1,2-diacylglycerol beta-glucosyltransferase